MLRGSFLHFDQRKPEIAIATVWFPSNFIALVIENLIFTPFFPEAIIVSPPYRKTILDCVRQRLESQVFQVF